MVEDDMVLPERVVAGVLFLEPEKNSDLEILPRPSLGFGRRKHGVFLGNKEQIRFVSPVQPSDFAPKHKFSQYSPP